jgi:hypothetical protein
VYVTVTVGLELPDDARVPGKPVLAPVIVVQLTLLYVVAIVGEAATALTALPKPRTTLPDGSDAPAVKATIKADVPDVFMFVSMTVTWLIVEAANASGASATIAIINPTNVMAIGSLADTEPRCFFKYFIRISIVVKFFTVNNACDKSHTTRQCIAVNVVKTTFWLNHLLLIYFHCQLFMT